MSHLLRPLYRRPHSLRLPDLSDLRLLPRLQLPHEAHIPALEDHRSAGLPGEGIAGPGARLAPTLDSSIKLADHGSEAAECPIECGELLAHYANPADNRMSLTLRHVGS